MQRCLLLIAALAVGALSGTFAQTDAQLLLAFRGNFTNGKTLLKSWKGTNPCTWQGITCNNNKRVIRIELPVKGLKGTIPAQGWVLPSELLVLDLEYNLVGGPLPATWPRIPQKLLELLLPNNVITGSLTFTLPPKLTKLDLANNRMTGGFPKVAFPSNLQYLQFFNNKMEGTLPEALTLPPKLVEFALGGNKWSGPMPKKWVLPKTLKAMYFYGCQLSGLLPNGADPAIPTWNRNDLVVGVDGNPKLCGPVPNVPLYYPTDLELNPC